MNPFEIVGRWLGGAIGLALDIVYGLGPVWSSLIATAAIFLETTLLIGLVVPGDTIVLAAATAIDTPWHFAVLLVLVIVGTLGGQSVGFLLGRYFGPWLRASWFGRRVGERNWARAERYIARRGGIAVFVSRFLPVLHALMPVTVGMSAMPYRRFMAWATPAAIIWASAYVTVGAVFGGSFRARLTELHYAGYIFAGGLLLFFVASILVKRWIERASERDMREADPEDGLTAAPDGRLGRDVRDHEPG